jgi:hypothetical protein
MAYIDVIPLEDAKVYLRVDDTLTEDDNSITRMINAALEYVEDWTNILVYDRTKSYISQNGCCTVYDAPINSVVTPASADDYTQTIKHGYSVFDVTSTLTEIELNVGHQNVSDIPQSIIDCAYEIIDLMYYSHETGKTVEKDLSELSKNILNKNKRFVF